jgi:hypothetical protein
MDRSPVRLALTCLTLTALGLGLTACSTHAAPTKAPATSGTAGTSASVPGAGSPGPFGSTPVAPTASASGAPSAPAPRRPSAADQLAGFFAAAERADRQIRQASRLIDGGFRGEVVVLDPATVAAVKAIDTKPVVRAIPGGLTPRQLRSVLQVYADLSSRRAAFNRVLEYASDSPLPRGSTNGKDLLTCLGHGSAAAARFADDLAASRALAAASAPVKVAPAHSRLTAEVAIRVHGLDLPNNGCGECGGVAPRPVVLHPIVWKRVDQGPNSAWDATIATGPFTTTVNDGVRLIVLTGTARYVPDHGWNTNLNAC